MARQSEVRDAGLCPHSVHPGGQRLRAATCSRGSKNRYEYGEGVRPPKEGLRNREGARLRFVNRRAETEDHLSSRHRSRLSARPDSAP